MKRGALVVLLAMMCPTLAARSDEVVLARLDGPPAERIAALPVYASLMDDQGHAYVLAWTLRAVLIQSGWSFRVLATNVAPQEVVVVRCRGVGFDRGALPGRVLHDDGRQLLLQVSAKERERIVGYGFEARALPEQPMVNVARDHQGRALVAPRLAALVYDARVAEMMGQVATTGLYAMVGALSGVTPAVTGGDLYSVRTRFTTNQVATQKAAQYALQFFQGLGLSASEQAWTASVYSNRNVIATIPGGALSNEVVLMVAHLDSISPSPRAVAPGADDNASGSVAVMAAASTMSRYRFDRTVRFVLFTGEEQALYGSQRYAALLSGAGEQVVGVFNMDMIAWDAAGGPTLRLHTRTTGSAGYAADLAIASAFTNVVGLYGLRSSLTPIITADGEAASDHSSFWDVGYPAILAIEDDYDDFNAYYHTTNDTLSRFNAAYYTAFARASVGTVAHLAQPSRRVPLDVVQVDSSTWIASDGVGVGTLYARHEEGALESGADARDRAWSAMPAQPYGRWLRVHTAPDGVALATDARPTNSSTLFWGQLTAITTGAAPFSCTNQLRFTALAPLESNRAYRVRARVEGRFAASGADFVCVTNLRGLLAGGGFLSLPMLTNLTNGAVYGAVDIGAALPDNEATNWPLVASVPAGAGMTIRLPAQVGFTAADVVEDCTNLAAGTWRVLQTSTTSVAVTAGNFERGWETAELGVATTGGGGASFYRVRRQSGVSP
jgi:hypothetical protein